MHNDTLIMYYKNGLHRKCYQTLFQTLKICKKMECITEQNIKIKTPVRVKADDILASIFCSPV